MFIPSDTGRYDITVGYVDGTVRTEIKDVPEFQARQAHDHFQLDAQDRTSEVAWVRADEARQ